MIPAPFRVVLDANVLYPFALRDVLLEAASKGFYQVYWSEQILEEAFRNLIDDGRMTPDQVAKLAATMRRAFPDAQVSDFEDLIPSMSNHPGDRHVAAAAVRIGAQVIVTNNGRHFRGMSSDIEAQSADEFLCNLHGLSPPGMLRVLRSIVARWQNPPIELLRLVDALGLSSFGSAVRASLASENQAQ